MRNKKGKTGTSLSTPLSIMAIAQRTLSAKNELKSMGKSPHCLGHGHKSAVQAHIADGSAQFEQQYQLIDYRNGNRVILEKVMTRLTASKKNKFLKGTGKAWAMVQYKG